MKRAQRKFPVQNLGLGIRWNLRYAPAAMIEIVPESPAIHADAIESLFDRTFGPGHFAKTAERLREFSASLPDINRIALDGDRIVAVTRAWPIQIEHGGQAIFIGPVAVDPEYRGDRLGAAVTSEVLDAGRRAGWSLALLIGAPDYFSHCGFKVVDHDRFKLPGPQDYNRVMLCEFSENAKSYRGAVYAAIPG
ncbi:MAG: N-acetyltransferase [Pseudomonadota bacterium]